MALQWQNIEIPIGGVDQYTDAPHVILTKMQVLENVRFYKPPSVSRRKGYDELGSAQIGGASLDSPLRLHGVRKETLMCSQSRVYSYGETPAAWSERGNISDFLVSQTKLINDGNRNICDGDLGISGSCLVCVWGGSANTIQGCILDLSSDTIVGTISFSGGMTAGQHRVLVLGTYIFVLFSPTTGGGISYAYLNTASTWSFSAASSLPTTQSVGTTPVWDACILGNSSDQFVVGYRRSSNDEPMVDLFTHVSGSVGGAPSANWANDAAINIPASTSGGACAIAATDNEDVYFVYNTDVPSTRRVVLSDTLVETVAPATLGVTNGGTIAMTHMAMCRLTSSSAFLLFEYPASGSTVAHTRYCSLSDAGAVGTETVLTDWVPASKPFMFSSSIRAAVMYESDEQPTFAVVELTNSSGGIRDPRWHATFARSRAADHALNNECFLPALVQDSTRGTLEVALGVRFLMRFAKVGDETITLDKAGIHRLRLDYASTHLQQGAEWGPDGFFVAGSRPSYYDGHAVAEHGFATYPERFAFSSATAAGGPYKLANGQSYSYVLVYEYLDATGNVIRSATSEVDTQTTTAANQHFVINFNETLLTARGVVSGYTSLFTTVRVVPYRTLAGPPADAVYYRDSTLGFSATVGSTVTVGTEFDDAALILNEQLYTTGDILDNAGTPPCRDVHQHNGRLWICGAEEQDWLWFSQPYQEGEQPRFNEALRVKVDYPVFALHSLDENLVAFHDAGISLVVGDGPPATGGLDLGFGVVNVPTDVGCIIPESIVTMPMGVMFQSAKGIYILKRDLSVEWIGAPIKKTLETYTRITGAVLMADAQQVVFTAVSADASIRIVYDYALDQWMIDTCHTIASTSARCWHSGRFTHVYTGPALRYFAQNTTTTTDSETVVTYPAIRIRTPYIKLNTLQGWQAVRRFTVLAKKLGNHGVTIKVDYDEAGTYAETHSWTIAEISALPREQLEIHTSRRKCESISFEFLETNVTQDSVYSPSAGPEVISFVVEGGFLPGGAKGYSGSTHRK